MRIVAEFLYFDDQYHNFIIMDGLWMDYGWARPHNVWLSSATVIYVSR